MSPETSHLAALNLSFSRKWGKTYSLLLLLHWGGRGGWEVTCGILSSAKSQRAIMELMIKK